LVFEDAKKWLSYLAGDGDAIYFTDAYGAPVVTRVSKCDGTARELPGLPNDPGTNAASLSVSSGNVAWLNLIDLGGEVIVAPIAPGGAARLLVSTTKPLSDSIGLDAEAAYFGDGALQRVPLAGGAPTPLVPGWLGVAAVDDARVYFNETPPSETLEVGGVLKAGGPSAILAGSVGVSGGFAQDDGAIYWLTPSGEGPGWSVVRVSKDGGDLQTLVMGEQSPYGIAVDETHVYWGAGGAPGPTQALRRAPKDGGVAEAFATGPIGVFTLDERSVYWSTGHALMKLDK
jgi:hypothetical protein